LTIWKLSELNKLARPSIYPTSNKCQRKWIFCDKKDFRGEKTSCDKSFIMNGLELKKISKNILLKVRNVGFKAVFSDKI